MSFRLSPAIVPREYRLLIQTDLLSSPPRYAGSVEIDIDIKEDSKTITLHAGKNLSLSHLSIKGASSSALSATAADKFEHDHEVDLLRVSTKGQFKSGDKITLSLCFDADIKANMMGYYLSSYKDKNGAKVNYALTQFEPVSARATFPCFDEPSFKAVQQITMISRKETVSISNMPVVAQTNCAQTSQFAEFIPGYDASPYTSTTASNDWVKTVFEKSPPMSTYLFAWANGNFEHRETSYISPLTRETKPLRIYSTPDLTAQTQFAIDTLAQVLPLYEKSFEVPFILPKCDTLVAHDFDAGAMENWGMITGRTSVYCYLEGKNGLDSKMRTATVASHEAAHMWFGDYATMKWWDNLWLNEAFATIVGEHIIPNMIYPEWNLLSAFIDTQLQSALALDALPSSHPVEQPCESVEMISQIFDAISYSKGASILRMLSHMVTQEIFLKGVSIYLKKHALGNTTTSDLWEGISEASGLDLVPIMTNWVSKIGFPLVIVEESKEGLHVSQERFFSGKRASKEENETIWYIPLALKTISPNGKVSVNRKAHLNSRSTTIPLEESSSKSYKINAESGGFYRVLYTPKRLQQLISECSQGLYTIDDKIGLVRDALVLAQSGWAKSSDNILEVASKLRDESDYLVWSSLAIGLNSIGHLFSEQTDEIQQLIKNFQQSLFSPIVNRLGWNYSKEEPLSTAQLRTLAISVTAASGDHKVIIELCRRFKKDLSGDDSETPADLERLIYVTGVKYGGVAEYELMLQRYNKPPTPASKVAAITALSSSKDPVLIQRTLDMIRKDVLMQDYLVIFSALSANPYARRMAWSWIQGEFDELALRFKGNFTLGRIIALGFSSLRPNGSGEDDVLQTRNFFKDKDLSSCEIAIKQGLDSMQGGYDWFNRDKDDILTWLRSQK